MKIKNEKTIWKTESFKHSFNIKKIINEISIFNLLESVDYYFAGGFPVALLLAPRDQDNLNKINAGYFSDIDIFFPSLEEFTKAENIFDAHPDKCTVVSSTENAKTYRYTIPSTFEMYEIQLVKKYFHTEEEMLDTFDIVNCSLTYNRNKETWKSHPLFLKANLSKKLTFSNPVMLNENYPDYPNSIFFQLERLAKYCQRYDLDLDVNAMKLLLKHNQKHPNLDYRKNEKLVFRGYYSTYSKTIINTFNVWESFNHIFLENNNWNYFSNHFKNIEKKEKKNETSVPF